MARILMVFYFIMAGACYFPLPATAQTANWYGDNEYDRQVDHYLKQAESYRNNNELDSLVIVLFDAMRLKIRLTPGSKTEFRLMVEMYKLFNFLDLHKNAVRFAEEALQIARANAPSDFGLFNSYGRLASAFLALEDWQRAIAFYEQSRQVAMNDANHFEVLGAINNEGMVYLEMRDTARARQSFNTVLSALDLADKEALQLSLATMDNLAELEKIVENYDRSVAIYDQIIQIARKQHITRRLVIATLDLAEIYLKMKQPDKANQLLLSLDKDWLKASRHLDDQPLQERVLQLQYMIFDDMGNSRMASDAKSAFIAFRDKRQSEVQRITRLAMEQISQMAIHREHEEAEFARLRANEQEQSLLAEKRKSYINRIILASVMIIGTLLIVGLIIFFRNKSKTVQRQKDLLTARNRLAEVELRNKELEAKTLADQVSHQQSDMTQMATYLGNIKESNAELITQLEDLASQKGPDAHAIRKLLTNMYARSNVEDKLQRVHENIDQVNSAFIQQLMEKHPDLSPNDREICSLIRLDMANKEISILKNVSLSAVKMARYRLRKKLGLDPDTDIYRYLKSK